MQNKQGSGFRGDTMNLSHNSQNRSLEAFDYQYSLSFKGLQQFYINSLGLFLG